MPAESRQISVVLVEQKMARMIRHNEGEGEAAEVKEVLNRVHRERRPRSRIICETERKGTPAGGGLGSVQHCAQRMMLFQYARDLWCNECTQRYCSIQHTRHSPTGLQTCHAWFHRERPGLECAYQERAHVTVGQAVPWGVRLLPWVHGTMNKEKVNTTELRSDGKREHKPVVYTR